MDAQLTVLELFTPVILVVSVFASYLLYCLLEPRVRDHWAGITTRQTT